jgi:hypothetical protein
MLINFKEGKVKKNSKIQKKYCWKIRYQPPTNKRLFKSLDYHCLSQNVSRHSSILKLKCWNYGIVKLGLLKPFGWKN